MRNSGASLRLNTIKDLINDDLDNYSDDEVRSEIARLVTTEGSWTRVKSKEWVKTETLLKEWRRIRAAIPLGLPVVREHSQRLLPVAEHPVSGMPWWRAALLWWRAVLMRWCDQAVA